MVELRRAVRDLSRSTPGGCARWPSWRPRRPAGASSCRRARGSASRRIAASSATSRPWSTWRSTTRARSPIPRVDTAIDCGFCVNPERVRSQIEGAAVMGLTLAKYGEITLQERRASSRATSTTTRSCASTSCRSETRVHIVEHAHRRAAERRRRAGRAAVRAGAVQRDLRRDRQAHPPAADRRSAGDLA